MLQQKLNKSGWSNALLDSMGTVMWYGDECAPAGTCHQPQPHWSRPCIGPPTTLWSRALSGKVGGPIPQLTHSFSRGQTAKLSWMPPSEKSAPEAHRDPSPKPRAPTAFPIEGRRHASLGVASWPPTRNASQGPHRNSGVGTSWLAGYAHANFSRRIHACESSRGRSLCEIELFEYYYYSTSICLCQTFRLCLLCRWIFPHKLGK